MGVHNQREGALAARRKADFPGHQQLGNKLPESGSDGRQQLDFQLLLAPHTPPSKTCRIVGFLGPVHNWGEPRESREKPEFLQVLSTLVRRLLAMRFGLSFDPAKILPDNVASG